jgi:transcriptional regulator with XRE-family HTH domain
MTIETAPHVGMLIRDWRTRRRLSQMELAFEAGISPRHLSFVETGRSQPGRATLISLAEALDVPLRDRNLLLLSAGSPPMQSAVSMTRHSSPRQAVAQILRAHEPFPALAIDRHWNLLFANRAVVPLLAGVADRLEAANQRAAVSLHQTDSWRISAASGAPTSRAAAADRPSRCGLGRCSPAAGIRRSAQMARRAIVVPLRLRTPDACCRSSAPRPYRTPLEVTLAELALESFFPADAATATALRALKLDDTAPPAAPQHTPHA